MSNWVENAISKILKFVNCKVYEKDTGANYALLAPHRTTGARSWRSDARRG